MLEIHWGASKLEDALRAFDRQAMDDIIGVATIVRPYRSVYGHTMRPSDGRHNIIFTDEWPQQKANRALLKRHSTLSLSKTVLFVELFQFRSSFSPASLQLLSSFSPASL